MAKTIYKDHVEIREGNLYLTSGDIHIGDYAVKDKVASLAAQIDAINLGAKVNLSSNIYTIYSGDDTNVTLSASMSGVVPSKISILEDSKSGTSIADGAANVSKTVTLNLTGDSPSKTYYAVAEYSGSKFYSSAVTIYGRHRIYYGFGVSTDLDSFVTNASTVGATTSASRTYTKTNSRGATINFLIMVPAGISVPSSYIMNGSDFVVSKSSITYGGVSYTLVTSGGVYPNGTEVAVSAS